MLGMVLALPVSVASTLGQLLSLQLLMGAHSGDMRKGLQGPRRWGWQVLSCPCCPRKEGLNHGLTGGLPVSEPVPASLSDRPFCFRARTTVPCARARFTPRTRTPRTRSCTRATLT